jgi:glycosyltransferase involved in cell wall biosynthesis
MTDHDATIAKMGSIAADAGLRRVSMLAWRDLDDPEAGGSEISAHMVAKYWAEAGLEVTMRTSFAAGRPPVAWRDGYRVIRKAGRYLVFPRAAFSEMLGWHGGRDGLMEVWNGMPFFSPLWSRTPHITFVHHLHAEMWQMTLPPRLAALGSFIESKFAPPFYRHVPIVTPSESSKRELVEAMHFKPRRVTVVHPGVHPRYSVGGERSTAPLVVAVGRLVPVKRYELLIDVLVELKRDIPTLQAVIAGDGYRRDDLVAQIRDARAETWIELPGRISDEAVVDLYRRAWVLASASAREGWGMSITEAGVCGTPAVATRIAGHLDAVDDGVSGLLVDGRDGLVDGIRRVLQDTDLRTRLSRGAVDHASTMTWEASALGVLEVLAAEALRYRAQSSPR